MGMLVVLELHVGAAATRSVTATSGAIATHSVIATCGTIATCWCCSYT